jgi:hypothetical protein
MMWGFYALLAWALIWCTGKLVNHPFKEDAVFNDTRYLNFNVDCENCGKRDWKYPPRGYYLSKRVCMGCGLIQEASSNPFLLMVDQEEQAWFTKGFVDDPVKLVKNWEEKHRKDREETLKRIAEKESKTKLFKADDVGNKGLFFTPSEEIEKTSVNNDGKR